MRKGVLVQKLKCLLPNDVSLANLNLSGSASHISYCVIQLFFFFYLNFYEIKDVIKFHVFEMGIWSTNRGRTGTRLFLFPFPMPSTFSSVAKFGVKTSMSPGERRMRCFVVYAKY